MENETAQRISNSISKVYFGIVFLCLIAEIFEKRSMVAIFKPLLIPTIFTMYFITSSKKYWVYLLALFFALSSNILLLFTIPKFLVYGSIAVLVFFILAIVVVFNRVPKILLLPFIIATIPFLFIFSSLINLTMTVDSPSFIPSAINGVLLSVFAGLALSSYVMNDCKSNSWLAISTLLFVVLAFLFTIQKYYLANIAFQPMSAVVFSFAHYSFYKFVIESEMASEIT